MHQFQSTRSRSSRFLRNFLINKTIDKIDFFSKPIPTFNMRGKKKIPSLAGGFLSISVVMVVLLYATVKLSHLLTRHNPQITQYLDVGALDSSYKFNFRDKGIRFAFGVEGSIDKKLKDDPRYVKIITRLYGRKDGKFYEKLIPVHYCTKEELDEFATPTADSQGRIDNYKN